MDILASASPQTTKPDGMENCMQTLLFRLINNGKTMKLTGTYFSVSFPQLLVIFIFINYLIKKMFPAKMQLTFFCGSIPCLLHLLFGGFYCWAENYCGIYIQKLLDLRHCFSTMQYSNKHGTIRYLLISWHSHWACGSFIFSYPKCIFLVRSYALLVLLYILCFCPLPYFYLFTSREVCFTQKR